MGQAGISIKEIKEILDYVGIKGLYDFLVGFRLWMAAQAMELEKNGGLNNLADEMATLILAADSLIRLIDSIEEDAEEQIPVSELRSRFIGLLRKADMLLARWQSIKAKGIER